MSILSNKASFVIAAAIVGAVSLASFAASAMPLKKPCIGCTPNTWTPGGHNNHHWNGGGYYGGGLSVGFATSAVADEGDCYFVRRRVFIDGVGVVMKRQMVCN
jgi:hypothetical protein